MLLFAGIIEGVMFIFLRVINAINPATARADHMICREVDIGLHRALWLYAAVRVMSAVPEQAALMVVMSGAGRVRVLVPTLAIQEPSRAEMVFMQISAGTC